MLNNSKKVKTEHWIWRAMPWIILSTGLLLTFAVESWARRQDDELARADFELRVSEVVSGLKNSLDMCAELLRGVTGLFAGSNGVERSEFRIYVEGLALAEANAGIQGVGFAQAIRPEEKEAHIRRIRSEGFPNYDIRPTNPRDFYTAIVYLEPFDWRNQRAFGFDMFSEPVRREAMERARDTGYAAMSRKVRLQQETDQDPQAGVLIYLPIYRRGNPLDTMFERRAALLGWAYAPLRIGTLVDSYLTAKYGELKKRLSITVYDGTRMAPDALIYQSALPEGVQATSFQAVHHILSSGGEWTVLVKPLPSYWQKGASLDSRTILLFGILITSLLAFIALLQRRSQARIALALEETRYANQALAERETLLQTIYDTATVAICVINVQGRIVHANRFMMEMFGRSASELVGGHFSILISTEELSDAESRFSRIMHGEEDAISFERRYRRKDDTEFWGMGTARVFRDAASRPAGIVCVIADITERRAAEEVVRHQALHDFLTGLPNRAYLLDQASHALEMAKRYDRRLAIFFLDLDRFKPINDEHGHDMGDEVLRRIAERLRTIVRASDTVSRIGGDEFVILVPEFSDFFSIETLASKLLSAVQEPCRIGELTLHVSVSIGVSTYPENADSVESLMDSADWAMYRAKATPEYPICFSQDATADRIVGMKSSNAGAR